MCPVCLATMGLYVTGGVSAGGITTYLAPDCRADDAINPNRSHHGGRKGTNDEGHPKEGEKSDDEAHDRDT